MDRTSRVVAAEPKLYGIFLFFRRPYVCHRVIGKYTLGGGFELIVVETFALNRHRQGRPFEHFVKFNAKDEQASCQADQDEIKPDGNTAPKMDLEQRSPRPYTLRPSPQALEKGRRFLT